VSNAREVNSAHTIITTISSYFLSCQKFVSFVVSLLNKDMWFKIKTEEKEHNPVISLWIVGMDGSMPVPITVNGKDYEQNFIVA